MSELPLVHSLWYGLIAAVTLVLGNRIHAVEMPSVIFLINLIKPYTNNLLVLCMHKILGCMSDKLMILAVFRAPSTVTVLFTYTEAQYGLTAMRWPVCSGLLKFLHYCCFFVVGLCNI